MKRTWWIAIAAVVLVVGVAIAAPFLLPKKSVTLNQSMPDAANPDAEVIVHRSGAWQDGDSRHKASGDISIVTVDGDVYLQFSDFSMTRGPDVYLYLTETAAPRSTADVEGNGIRIAVQTDADKDGRLNERGDFFVPVDMTLAQLSAYEGVAAWCDDFNVLFASAAI